MSDLAFYFREGWQHIISLDALDHQLFVVALAAIYTLKEWRKVLILVTAFTIGHSVTLVLSAHNLISINNKWVEFLIPCTILITAGYNFFQKSNHQKNIQLNYFFALFFGLIHGMGFANTIRFMLAKDQTISWGLFGFNIGLEAGQIVIVSTILLMSYLVVNTLKVPQKWWVFILSAITFTWAVKFAMERIP